MSFVLKILVVLSGLFFSRMSFGQCSDISGYIEYVNTGCANLIAGSDPTAFYCYGPGATFSDIQKGMVRLSDGTQHYACYSHYCNQSGFQMHVSRQILSCNRNIETKIVNKFEKQVNMCGSIVKVSSEVLGESIPLVGAKFKLNYFTNYAHRLYDYTLTIPPNPTVPANVQSLTITIATNLPTTDITVYGSRPAVDIVHTWNGNDSSGNPMWGTLTHNVTVSESRGFTFGTQALSNTTATILGSFKAQMLGIGGWLPSVYNFYDKNSNTLYLGDGSFRKVTVSLDNSSHYVVPEKDGSLVYIFDSSGRHLETKLGVTGTSVYVFAYDGASRLASITEPFSQVTTFNRDGSGKLLSITAPYSKTTSVIIDSAGFLTSLSSPLSETYSMTYNTRGILQTFTKPNTATSTFTYDSSDRLIKDEHISGSFISLLTVADTNDIKNQSSTSKMGRVSSIYSATKTTSYGYDYKHINPNGSSNSVYGYAESTTENGFDEMQNNAVIKYTRTKKNTRFNNLVEYPTRITNVPGVINRITDFTDTITYVTPTDPFSINTWTNTAKIGTSIFNSVYTGSTKTFVNTSPLNRTSTYQWDAWQRPVFVQQGNLMPTTFTYVNEKLTALTQGARVTTLNYNPSTGLLSSILNPLSQTTSFSYDSADRLSTVTLPDLRVLNYTYNSNGELKTITPSGKPVHTFNFGITELISSYVPPSLIGVANITTTYAYNNDKQLTQILRPDAQAINFNYNAGSGMLTTITTPQRTLSYLYTGMSTSTPVITLSYGSASLVFSYSSGVLQSLRTNYASGYSIYSSTRDTTLHGYIKSDKFDIYSVPSVINYLYDADELLTSAGSLALTYDVPNGQLATTTLGNITDARTYNTMGELTGYQGQIAAVNSYGYSLTRDALGRVATKSQTLPGVGTDNYAYSYDVAGRLTQVTKNAVVVANYAYDGNNNRTSGNIGSQTTTGIYDNQDRMTNYNTFTYEYNANGERTKKTNTTTSQITLYAYDAIGNLTQVTLPSGVVITYEIDGLNRRIGKSINGVLQRRYAYIDQYRIGAEMDASLNLLRRYVYASRSNIPDYYIEGSTNYRIFSDHLGSFRMAVNVTTGATVCTQDNDEFGRVILSTTPGCLPFGFAGGLYDSDTGLVQFGARPYDSETGRWLSKDPIGFRGGDTNLYGYVMNDPVNFIDPTGKFLFALPFVAPAIVQGVAYTAALISGASTGWLINKIINVYQNQPKRPMTGPPSGVIELPNGDKRFYDEDGNPTLDEDWGHDRGHGVPHFHDWFPVPGGGFDRGPARPPKKDGDCK